MALLDNERVQEWFMLAGDRLASVKRFWWYLLLALFIFGIPAQLILKSTFAAILLGGYTGPEVLSNTATKEPLQILDKKVFEIAPNTYVGLIRIRNVNLEWGVGSQEYHAVFQTFGGTALSTLDRTTYILPASEKAIILPSFRSDTRPDELVISLSDTHFIRKPDVSFNFEVERTSISNTADGMVVSSAFKNLTPFTIKQVDLPVLVYDTKNEVVGVNYTYVNDVKSSETRTFQYIWSQNITGAVRAEINPEINLMDPNIFIAETAPTGGSSADRPK